MVIDESQKTMPVNSIPLCVPVLQGNEWKYVKECLDTNWVSSVGAFVDRFEEKVAIYVGAKYAVAVTNGTSALHIALLVSGVKPDDEVLVSTLSFVAPANAIRYVGAWPVFIDAEPEYWQMDTQKAIHFIEKKCNWVNGTLRNRATGRQVKAILPVHVLGHPVDINPVLEIARKYNLIIIEDAAQSIGARYNGKMVGCLGDIACFSFNGNKIITCGGGGMIVTNREDWARKAKYLTTQARDELLEYIHNEIGYNYRLTNIQAAIGVAQMEKLDEYITKKRSIADTYSRALGDLPCISTMREASWAYSSFWLYTILIDKMKNVIDNRSLMRQLMESGIQTRPLWQPLNLSPAYTGVKAMKCPVAERLNQEALSLPCSVSLHHDELAKVIDKIIDILTNSQ